MLGSRERGGRRLAGDSEITMMTWAKRKNGDIAKIVTLLTQLNFSRTQLTFLPTKDQQDANLHELAVSRETLSPWGTSPCSRGTWPSTRHNITTTVVSTKLSESEFPFSDIFV